MSGGGPGAFRLPLVMLNSVLAPRMLGTGSSCLGLRPATPRAPAQMHRPAPTASVTLASGPSVQSTRLRCDPPQILQKTKRHEAGGQRGSVRTGPAPGRIGGSVRGQDLQARADVFSGSDTAFQTGNLWGIRSQGGSASARYRAKQNESSAETLVSRSSFLSSGGFLRGSWLMALTQRGPGPGGTERREQSGFCGSLGSRVGSQIRVPVPALE